MVLCLEEIQQACSYMQWDHNAGILKFLPFLNTSKLCAVEERSAVLHCL